MTSRDAQKARYQAYRLAARSGAYQGAVRVPEYSTVQEVEDGAFVEAIVWVPRRTIEDPPIDTLCRRLLTKGEG